MRMSTVLFSFFWQVLFTHDTVSLWSIFGALLVSSSIVIMLVFKEKEQTMTVATESSDPSASAVYNPVSTEDGLGIEMQCPQDEDNNMHWSVHNTIDSPNIQQVGSTADDDDDDEGLDYIFTAAS